MEHAEEDHRGEQATTPQDLDEEGKHQKQGTQSTLTEGDHPEEQESRKGVMG
jgi:hypothetical protein